MFAIIDHLHDHPEIIRKLSLICRSLVPTTRRYGFRRITIRSWHHLESLLRLCESNLETLTHANVKEVAFLNLHALYNGWPSKKFVKMFGGSIHTLRMEGNGYEWERAPREAMGAMLSEFGGLVKRLEIAHFHFASRTSLARVFRSFEGLQSLETAECFLTDWGAQNRDPEQIDMTQITELTLDVNNDRLYPNMLDNCSFRALKSLRVRSSHLMKNYMTFHLGDTQIKRILREAGENLHELDVDVKFVKKSHAGITAQDVVRLQERYIIEALNLAKNTNLRRLRLAIRFGDNNLFENPTNYLLPILEHLAGTAGQGLHALDLSYVILEHPEMDWNALDEILQHPFFSELKEVRCGGVVCCFSERDCVNGDYSRPSETSEPGRRARDAIEMLKLHLPRCKERGVLLSVGVTYRLLSLFTPVEITRKQVGSKKRKKLEFALKVWKWGKGKLASL
ncbi:hypothetical protein Moror_11523 [Moniliophthora roreri MCA 2997]|uniref:F-box domain-containing protein n=1 Tax=Moniliophthora roreri (strain MCA 2997) TaxID=1381753 RepID=V2WUY1_MONRO|nr:hypothetical protein Moror_11523 [Moniliophthora roreri MCA 2997]